MPESEEIHFPKGTIVRAIRHHDWGDEIVQGCVGERLTIPEWGPMTGEPRRVAVWQQEGVEYEVVSR